MSVIHTLKDPSRVRATDAPVDAVHLRIGFAAPAAGLAFADLSTATLALIAPEVILAPLISRDFDALDLLDRLCDLQYQGRVRFHASKLPNLQIVLRELRSVAQPNGMFIELLDVA